MGFSSRRFTYRGIRETLEYGATALLALFAAFLVLQVLYLHGLLNVSEVISLGVAELPLGLGLWWILGERSRGHLSDAKDNIELWERYSHLVIHFWYLLGSRIGTLYYVVENSNTKTAYDCPRFLGELASRGIIHKIKHKNEPEMREYLKAKQITIVEREATFLELQP